MTKSNTTQRQLFFGDSRSAFIQGSHERPLRITFHSASLVGLPPEETEALEAIHQLAHLSEVSVLDTVEGPFPHLEIGDFDITDSNVPITVKAANSTRTFAQDKCTYATDRKWPAYTHACSVMVK